MGVDHPGLPFSMQDLIRTVRRIARQTIQNASIGRAGIRVYDGGWIRIEDGGLQVTGIASVSGRLEGSGTLDWTGPVNLKGAQSVTGPTTFTGQMTVNGPWKFVGNGEITGDVDLKGVLRLLSDLLVKAGGKIVIEGADPIVLTQESGAAKVKVGSVGEISGSDTGIQMMVEGEFNRRVVVKPSGIMIVGMPTGAGTPTYWVGADIQGNLFRYPAGSGGPMGGDFDWPFSLSIVTSEYGMRTHPVTGEERLHAGIDFGAPEGASIPASSAGTVVAASFDSGRGNYVVLSHPNNVETHYFHMLSAPAVSVGQSVSKGQTLGQVGSTGLSSGPHLHFEVHVNGTAINPRDFDPLD